MDEMVFPAFSSSSLSLAASTAGHHQELEPIVSCDVLEDWLRDQDWLHELLINGPTCGDEGSGSGSRSPGNDLSGLPPAPAPNGRRRSGRKQGRPTKDKDPALCHVEAERQRRDRLNRRFCELRAAVPTVSRMNKASVLSDATTYIAELRDRVKVLEAEAKKAAMTSAADVAAAPTAVAPFHSFSSLGLGDQLVVQMVGEEAAALRLTTTARHSPQHLMDALRCLNLPLQHASVCVVGGMTVLDAIVDVPAVLRDERALRDALLHRLRLSG